VPASEYAYTSGQDYSMQDEELRQTGRRTTANRTKDYSTQDEGLQQAGRRTTASGTKNYVYSRHRLRQAPSEGCYAIIFGFLQHLLLKMLARMVKKY
jgi:hypothetical protein